MLVYDLHTYYFKNIDIDIAVFCKIFYLYHIKIEILISNHHYSLAANEYCAITTCLVLRPIMVYSHSGLTVQITTFLESSCEYFSKLLVSVFYRLRTEIV